ncbi:MAG: peptidase S41 [Finegoldia sp.]|uniref:peptidase S41 n=1 Tax=Finegoldia sp. TaxID=1981334 RepID=UPI0028FFE977|nr:peptidase S41 [Finegoldia magna]
MKKTKRSQKIILFLLTCILALNTQTRGFAKNELDNEILTIPIELNLNLEEHNLDDLRVKQLGKIELNRVLTKSEYEKDMKNFINYYLEWQAYLGNSTREEIEKLGEELLKTSDNKTVSDLNLDFAKLIANTNDGHTSAMYGIGKSCMPIKIRIINGDYYIINTTPEYEDLLYSKIIKFADIDTKDITERLYKYTSAENKYFKNTIIKDFYLYYGDALEKENIIKNGEVKLQIETDGKKLNKKIKMIDLPDFKINKYSYENTDFSQILYDMTDITKNKFTKNDKMRYMKMKPFYYYINDTNLIIQYNNCYNTDKNNILENMIEKMDKDVSQNNIEKIIVDVRYNTGGWPTHARELELALKRYQLLNPKLEIKLLTGSENYSAGSFFVDGVKRNLDNLQIIGENTGGPSGWTTESSSIMYLGSSKLFVKKSSGVTRYDYTLDDVVHCSNLNKRDGSTWYPDMFIENQIQDYAIGNDRVMNYAINN